MSAQKNKIKNIKVLKQSGAALLIAMVVLASVAAIYLMAQFGSVNQKLDRQDSRVAALAEAKKALIAYAVNYIDAGNDGEYGFLPCPDFVVGGFVPEGGSDGCTGIINDPNVSVLGRFPWRSLEIKPLRDDANECLWYAVSGPYKNGVNKTQMLNDDTNGLFEIYDGQGNIMHGNTPEERVVAVILAPGVPLNGQNRVNAAGSEICGGSYNAANYLEADPTADAGAGVDNSVVNNAPDTVSKFIKAGTNTAVNDRLAIITQGDIWQAVKRRRDFITSPSMKGMQDLTRAIAGCIKEYGDLGSAHNLPWPAPLDLTGVGTDYRIDGNYIDASVPTRIGRLPDILTNSEAKLLDLNGAGGGGTAPPACQNCLDQCQQAYDSDIAEAQQDYNDEIADADRDLARCLRRGRRPQVWCQTRYDGDVAEAEAERVEDLADAQRDYDRCVNRCLRSRACRGWTPGGGGSGPKGESNLLSINFAGTATPCLSAAEYSLWQNWKDHFFYAVSPEFAPDSQNVFCSGSCITTNGGASSHAAIVMFSGQRQTGQRRNDPVAGDTDTKEFITNYLENGNEVDDGSYDASAGNAVNVNNPVFPADFEADYLYCIDDANPNMTIVPCP